MTAPRSPGRQTLPCPQRLFLPVACLAGTAVSVGRATVVLSSCRHLMRERGTASVQSLACKAWPKCPALSLASDDAPQASVEAGGGRLGALWLLHFDAARVDR